MTRKSFLSLIMVFAMVLGLALPAYASAAPEFTVAATYDETKGSVSIGYPSGKSSAAEGETVRINTEPKAGYVLDSISAPEGVTLTPVSGSEGDYTVVMPAENVTVTVTFAEPDYDYSLSLNYDDDFGYVEFEDDREGANQGDKVRVYIDCNEGYEVATVKARYNTTKTITAEEGLDWYEFTMPAANVTVEVTFRSTLGDYEITLDNDDTKGDVSVLTAADKGDVVYVYVIPMDGYQVADIEVYRTSKPNNEDYSRNVSSDSGRYYFSMPAYDVTVEVTYTSASGAYYAELDYDTSEGYVYLNKHNANSGDVIKVRYDAVEGYEVVDVTTTPAVTVEEASSYYYFLMPSSDVTVHVEFGEYTGEHDVKLDFDGVGGKVTFNRDEADKGDEVRIYIDTDGDYDLDSLVVTDEDGNTVKTYAEDDYYYFTMPDSDVEVSVELYEYDGSGDYDVDLANVNSKYGVVRLSQTTADSGEKVYVNATPASGYKVLEVLCVKTRNQAEVSVKKSSTNKYYFTMPTADVTVTVLFAKSGTSVDSDAYEGDYDIELDYEWLHGEVDLSRYAADAGNTVKIEATPDDGYEIDDIFVIRHDTDEYVTVKKASTYTYFTMPASDVTVYVEFVDEDDYDDDDDDDGDYDIDLSYDDDYGYIRVTPKSADRYEDVKVFVYPEKGYEIDEITVRKDSDNSAVDVEFEKGYYVFEMPKGDVTVYAEFYETEGDYFVDVDFDDDYGNVTVSSKNAANNETVKVYVNTFNGIGVDSVKCYNDRTNKSITVNKSSSGYYTFKMPSDDVTVYVVFEGEYDDDDDDDSSSSVAGRYDIDVFYDDNLGEVDLNYDTAKPGTKITVTVDPEDSNSVKTVNVIATKDGEYVTVKRSATNNYYFTMPDSDVFVDVVFKAEATGSYDIDYSYDSDEGSVSGSATMAGRNTDIRVYVTPKDGYLIESVTVSRKDTSRTVTVTEYADHVYCFTMPAADAKVTVTFTAKVVNYAVNATVDSTKGTASLSANVAPAGTVIKVTPKANVGYLIDKVTVTEYSTNKAVTVTEANGVYSFTMPAASVNLSVTFKKQPVNYYIVSEYDKALGEVALSAGFATAGTTVTVTVKPADEYEVASILGTHTSNGTTVICTPAANGTYTFVMPEDNVKVAVTFKKAVHVCNVDKFADVDVTEWYHAALDYVVKNNIMNGIGKDEAGKDYFDPKGTTTRAMVTTVLWRIAGSPKSTAPITFTDVAEGQWYADAVRWAAANGFLAHVAVGDKFEPNSTITREQFADMIYLFEVYKAGGNLEKPAYQLSFSDLSLLSDWAKDSMNWCNVNKIINGNANGTLNPKGSTTRAELAQILLNYKDFN